MTLSSASTGRPARRLPFGAATDLDGSLVLQPGRLAVTAMLVALVALASGLVFASSASAHGGPFELQVSTDGAGGIAVFAIYEEDGHVVNEIIDPVAEATSADGQTAGPVALISSSEGEGRWVTEEPFLGNGDWTVIVTTTTPEEARATVEFTVAPLEPPVEPDATVADEELNDDASTMATTDAGKASSTVSVGLIVAIVAGLAVLAAVVIILVRRRSRDNS